jgi:hypothetical protein
MPRTRVVYDKLPPGSHTIVPVDSTDRTVDPGTGFYPHTDWERVDPNGIVEVEDIADPKSHRAYQVRGHLHGFGSPGQYGYQGPLATLIEGPDAMPTPPPAIVNVVEQPEEAKAAGDPSTA